MPGDELTVEASGGVYSVDGQNNVIHYYLSLNNYEAIDDRHACMYDGGGYTGAMSTEFRVL